MTRIRLRPIYGLVALTLFFGFWKVVGMPPGYRGDYLDLFDDVVALSGMASAVCLLIMVKAWRK